MIDQYASLSEKFLKKGFWLYFFSFIVSPIGYFIKIILSGDLDVAEIGIIYGVISLMTLISSFNDFGLTESLNKFIPQYITENKYDKVKTILSYAFLIQMGTGVIVFILFYFGAEFISLHYFQDTKAKEVIQVFSFFFLGINIFQIQQTLFQAVQNTFIQKLGEFIRMIFVFGYTFIIFFLDSGTIISYSYGWLLGLAIGIIFNTYFFYKLYYRPYLRGERIIFSSSLFKKILHYSFLVFLGSQAATILSQVDMQMIIYLLGNTDAGYYSNYLSIISIPFMLIGPILGLLFPIFSELYAKKETEKILRIKKILYSSFLSFSIVFSFLFFVFGPEISVILFGEKFRFSGEILQWSILFLGFLFLLQINFNIYAAIGRITVRLYIILFGLSINIITNYILINTIGVAGAAIATGIGWILIWGLSEIYLKEYFVAYNFKYLLKNILLFLIISVFLWIYIKPIFIPLDRKDSFFLLGCISIIYFGFYILINKGEFQQYLQEIKKIRKNTKASLKS